MDAEAPGAAVGEAVLVLYAVIQRHVSCVPTRMSRCGGTQGPVIETAKTWIVQSVTPSEADTNAGGEEAAESSRANSVDGALKSAADAATSLIGDMYEMEVCFGGIT